jgi:hypothetical protein
LNHSRSNQDRRWRRRPLEQKAIAPVRSRVRKGRRHQWCNQQATTAVEARAYRRQRPESTVGALVGSRARGRRRRWERWRLAQAAAPIDHPATMSASLWPSAHRRPVAARGGASTSHSSSPATIARGWWSRATVWAVVLAVASCPPI